MKWDLRNRILVPTIGLMVLVTTTLVVVMFAMSRHALARALDEQLVALSASAIDGVEHWLEGHRNNIVLWSNQAGLKAALGAGPEGERACRTISAELNEARKLLGSFEEIQLADSTGLTVASSNETYIGRINVADRTYFRQAMGGATVMSEVLASKMSGRPVVVLASPVRNGEAVIGVLYGVVDMGWFSENVVARLKVLETGYACLFDAAGQLVAHPDPERILKEHLDSQVSGADRSDRGHGVLDLSMDGESKRGAFRTSDTLGWTLLATVSRAEVNAPFVRMGKVCAGIGIGAALIAAALLYGTIRSIARPIQNAADQLLAGAAQTTASALQVSDASQALATGASQQAAAVEQSSSSLEMMSAVVARNAEHAVAMSDLAKQARDAAETGATCMRSMETAMAEIKASGDDIGTIMKTIDEIAFQTNLLALNAAVEAARAGEAGAGFAVVAGEVRNLAQRASRAASETEVRIEKAISKTRQGVEITKDVAGSLREIVAKSRQVEQLAGSVAEASRDQIQSISEITTAVRQMDAVVQSNAANAEETASAAEELSAQAGAMRECVGGMLALVRGSRPPLHDATMPTPRDRPAGATREQGSETDGNEKPTGTTYEQPSILSR